MSLQNRNENYLGNPNIKKDGIVSNFNEEQVLEYAKCMKDPVYFVEKYAKIISLDKGLVPFELPCSFGFWAFARGGWRVIARSIFLWLIDFCS